MRAIRRIPKALPSRLALLDLDTPAVAGKRTSYATHVALSYGFQINTVDWLKILQWRFPEYTFETLRDDWELGNNLTTVLVTMLNDEVEHRLAVRAAERGETPPAASELWAYSQRRERMTIEIDRDYGDFYQRYETEVAHAWVKIKTVGARSVWGTMERIETVPLADRLPDTTISEPNRLGIRVLRKWAKKAGVEIKVECQWVMTFNLG
ncbi:hypothetical protein ACQY0O_003672 [Thecaphora frezii]